MSAWWNSLQLAEQIFFSLASIASLVLVLQMLLSFLGGEFHHDLALGHDGEHPSGLGVFSIRTVAAFFAGFGWVGVIAMRQGFGAPGSGALGAVVGTVLMLGTLAMMRSLAHLQSSGTLDYSNALGSVATVYVPIPADRVPGGQVEVLIQGRTVFAEALAERGEPIPTGTKVRIVSLVGKTCFLIETL